MSVVRPVRPEMGRVGNSAASRTPWAVRTRDDETGLLPHV